MQTQNGRNFRLNCKHLLLTYPRHDGTTDELMTFLKAKLPLANFICVCQELHLELVEDAIPTHLHAFIQAKKCFDIKSAKFLDFKGKHGDYRSAIDPPAALKYCSDPSKEGYMSHITWGEFTDPKKRKQDGDKEHQEKMKERNALLLNSNPVTLVDEGELSLLELPRLIKAKEVYKNLTIPPAIIERECTWIQGAPGVGKSYYVRTLHQDVYEKNLTKWWDGYTTQDVVLVDDFEITSSQELSHFMKIWPDSYRFSGEVKGGTLYPKYTKFYVTSNYLPSQIWDTTKDLSLFLAVNRRFTIKRITLEEDGKRYIEILYRKGVEVFGEKEELNN